MYIYIHIYIRWHIEQRLLRRHSSVHWVVFQLKMSKRGLDLYSTLLGANNWACLFVDGLCISNNGRLRLSPASARS